MLRDLLKIEQISGNPKIEHISSYPKIEADKIVRTFSLILTAMRRPGEGYMTRSIAVEFIHYNTNMTWHGCATRRVDNYITALMSCLPFGTAVIGRRRVRRGRPSPASPNSAASPLGPRLRRVAARRCRTYQLSPHGSAVQLVVNYLQFTLVPARHVMHPRAFCTRMSLGFPAPPPCVAPRVTAAFHC
jgi:hypothetical protein